MAVPEVPAAREDMSSSKQKTDKRLVVQAQEIQFAKCLAGNEKKTRDRALKSLRRWLGHRCESSMPLARADLMLIWKGLFYSMWMSDKPLVQEECAENIAHLIHALKPEVQMLFYKCAMATLGNEWIGIDQLRMDKFLMLVRRLLRQALFALKHQNWDARRVREFQEALDATVLCNADRKPPLGLTLHFVDVFLEELAKASGGEVVSSVVAELLTPFARVLCTSDDSRHSSTIVKSIFRQLLRQSDAGIEYSEKFNAWRQLGFPGGSIDAMRKEKCPDDVDGEDNDEPRKTGPGALDPRAGRVDVVLPQLRFSSKRIVKLLERYKFLPGSNSKSRKVVSRLIEEFTEMSQGRYPLGTKKVKLPQKEDRYNIKQSVKKLVEFEKELYKDSAKKRKAAVDAEVEEPEVKKRKKSPKHTDDITNRKIKLKRAEPVAKKTKKIRTKLNESTLENLFHNFELSFQRNSGTWFVYNGGEESDTPNATPVKEKKSLSSAVYERLLDSYPQKKSETPIQNGDVKKTSPKKRKSELNGDVTPKSLFKQTEWDTPLQDGETEFFVASKKFKSKIRGKSLGGILPNPLFVKPASPSSAKKVKIDLRLNRSQEIHEHVETIKKSPAIPFDATRRPSKPLLKPSAVSSPINPFYKRKLNLSN